MNGRKPIVIKAHYRGNCGNCSSLIRAGELIHYYGPGQPVTHVTCPKDGRYPPYGNDPDCAQCKANEGKLTESHNGSRNCRSGSLASGGTRAHCTCDFCY